MTDVYLHGALAEEFGAHFTLDVATPREAFWALEANFPGRFRSFVADKKFHIIRGDLDGGLDLGEEEVAFKLGNAPVHFVPAVEGAKRSGGLKAVLGVAIMGVAIVASGGFAGEGLAANMGVVIGGNALGITFGNVAMFGLTMALSGIAQMISPTPKMASSFESPDRRASFIFNGPQNLTEQGATVPLIYGRIRTGSVVVSAGVTNEDIKAS